MIVVTGTPRSGTSFVMNTLREAGYRIAGEQFLEESGPPEFNPQGYWDLPISEIWQGIDHNGYAGHAVKLLGLYASLSDISYFEGLILCRRNRKDSIRSLYRLFNACQLFCGNVAWLMAEGSYDINKKCADEVYMKYRGRKTILSIDEGTMTEEHIRRFASCQ